MITQQRLREIANLRLRFQMNNRLRLETLAALSKVFREFEEPLEDELLAGVILALPEELFGGGGPVTSTEFGASERPPTTPQPVPPPTPQPVPPPTPVPVPPPTPVPVPPPTPQPVPPPTPIPVPPPTPLPVPPPTPIPVPPPTPVPVPPPTPVPVPPPYKHRR